MDDIDLVILDGLREDARVTSAELGRRVKLSPKAVTDRIHRLEDTGVITGYHAGIDATKIGFPVRAYLHVKAARASYSQVISLARDLPEVREAHHVGEPKSFVLRVVARSQEDLQRLSAAFEAFGPVKAAQILSTPVEKHTK